MIRSFVMALVFLLGGLLTAQKAVSIDGDIAINCSCGVQVGEGKGAANGAAIDYTDGAIGSAPSGWPDASFTMTRVVATNAYELSTGGKNYIATFYDNGTWSLTNVTAGTTTTGTYT